MSRQSTPEEKRAPLDPEKTSDSEGSGAIERDVEDEDIALDATKSTRQDALDMARMGHKQKFVRGFSTISMICFVSIATANWEINVLTVNQGLIDGGRAGFVWSYIWNFFGFLPIFLSLVEMASMAPIAGSQYHWVSEFAPRRFQKVLSYLTGWLSTLAWQAGNAQGIILFGTLVQTLISFRNVEYGFARWQGTLIAIADAVVVLVALFFCSRLLPKAQYAFMALHIVMYVIIFVVIWVKAPHATATQVFTEFENRGGWSSTGLSVLVAQLGGISANVGIDTAAHMSEETADASITVPRAMFAAYFVNALFIIPMIITMAFAMPDLDAALSDPSTYPFIYILRQCMDERYLTALVSFILVLFFLSGLCFLASVSRDMMAFGRDNGLPFGQWISKVHKTRHVPHNSFLVTVVISSLLSLIYIGSPVAYYALTSLFITAIMPCYMISIASLLYRRTRHPDTLPPARWTLGRTWGPVVNVLALAYAFWAFFWVFWPQVTPVNEQSFNWAVVLFLGVVLLSMSWYVVRGRKQWVGPVARVKTDLYD